MADVIPIPAFEDNYLWLLVQGNHAAVVDPGDAEPVWDYLVQHQLKLCAILCTHHHGDHIGGIRSLLAHGSVPVYGPAREAIPGRTVAVKQGDVVSIPELALEFAVLDVPGHTIGHVAYYGADRLFCGDTVFGCGCGKLFEGTPPMMHASLSKIAALPDHTLLYCAHEYTLENMQFAKTVEPGNTALRDREAKDRQRREQGLPTVPFSLGLEKQTNPFLRSHEASVIQAAETHTGQTLSEPAQVFAAVRAWKDTFR